MTFPLRQLQYLCVLAETGSYHTAARKLYITQPTLSIAIKKLEESLGVPLFLRDGRSVTPTPEGELVLAYARKILDLNQELASALLPLQQRRQNSLRIGTYLIYSSLLMPTLIAAFHRTHPDAEIKLTHEHHQELLQGLKNNQFDVILSIQDQPDPEFAQRLLKREPLLLALSPDHPACAQAIPVAGSPYSFLDLEALPKELLLLQRPYQQVRLQEDKLLKTAGLNQARFKEVGSIETAVRLAAEGMGAAFCMSSYVHALHIPKPIRYFLTGDLQTAPWLTLSYAKGQEHNPTLRAFLRLTQETVAQIL